MTRLRRVVLVYQTNPFAETQGGGAHYVRSLARSLAREARAEVWFVGASAGGPVRGGGSIRFVPIVEQDSSWPPFFARLWRLPGWGRGTVVHVFRPYFLPPFWGGGPRVVTVPGIHFENLRARWPRGGGAAWPALRLLEAACLARADCVQFFTERQAALYRARHPFLARRATACVLPAPWTAPGPSAESPGVVRTSFGLPRGAPLVAYAGRLAAGKNLDLLLDAFARVRRGLPEAHLAIAGDGEDGPRLRARAGEGVTFLGALPHDRAVALLGAADVAALTSRFELSPYVVREAVALGTRVVSTAVGDVPDVLAPELGRIVPPEAAAVAAALEEILRSPADRADVRRRALARLRERRLNLTEDEVARWWWEAYERLAYAFTRGAPPPGPPGAGCAHREAQALHLAQKGLPMRSPAQRPERWRPRGVNGDHLATNS